MVSRASANDALSDRNDEMKTTIEEIAGKKYTVVWHGSHTSFFDEDHHAFCDWIDLNNGVVVYLSNNEHIATALPALPRKPKPEDARLLHLYAAHGITPMGKRGAIYPARTYRDDATIVEENDEEIYLIDIETIDATDSEGNCVKVAIGD
jgi:hypothetical protein